MSARVDHRDLARRQRRDLEADGFTRHQIREFAQLFTQSADSVQPRIGCAADQEES